MLKDLMARITATPPHQPPFVIERAETWPPSKLFAFLGVDWLATPFSWIAPVWILALGELISFLGPSKHNPAGQLLTGLVYSALIAFSIVVHAVGQIIDGRMANAPMKAVVVTSTLFYEIYEDKREYPSRVHLMRAVSGPLTNLLVGCAAFAVYFLLGRNEFALVLAVVNMVFTLAALMPAPTMDGGAILHELRHWRSA